MAETKKNGAALPPYNPDNIYNMGTSKDCGVPKGIIKVKEYANIEYSNSAAKKGIACPRMPENGQRRKEKDSAKEQRVFKVKSDGKNKR